MAMNHTSSSVVAARISGFIEAEERGRSSLYFRTDGRPLTQGGRNFGKLNRSGANGAMDLGRSLRAAYIIEYPFRPSPASCEDMVREFEETGKPVVYDEARWDNDPRIDEQIGPSLIEDWALEQFLHDLERGQIAA